MRPRDAERCKSGGAGGPVGSQDSKRRLPDLAPPLGNSRSGLPARPGRRLRLRNLRGSHTHRAHRPGAAARRPRNDVRPALRAGLADWAPRGGVRVTSWRMRCLVASNGRGGKLPVGRAGFLRDRLRPWRRRGNHQDSGTLGEAKMLSKGKDKRRGKNKDKDKKLRN